MRCFICNIVCGCGRIVKGEGGRRELRAGGISLDRAGRRTGGLAVFAMLIRARARFGPLKPLRFQFISSIFSFQIHIFLTKVFRSVRDFCLFLCSRRACSWLRARRCMKTFHSLDQMSRKKMYTKATVKFESLKRNGREMKAEAATNV